MEPAVLAAAGMPPGSRRHAGNARRLLLFRTDGTRFDFSTVPASAAHQPARLVRDEYVRLARPRYSAEQAEQHDSDRIYRRVHDGWRLQRAVFASRNGRVLAESLGGEPRRLVSLRRGQRWPGGDQFQ